MKKDTLGAEIVKLRKELKRIRKDRQELLDAIESGSHSEMMHALSSVRSREPGPVRLIIPVR
jgi:hypothetical protein